MVRYSEHRSFFLSALTCIALSACGGGGSGGGDRDAQPVLTSLSVSPAELTLEALGATAQLEATARDQNGNALSALLTWGSSDTVVVTVDADGLVTALNNGTTMVTVRSGGVSASVSVTVEQAPASVTVSSDEVVLTALGATEQLQASVFDANDRAMAAEVAWASSDAAVASVDEDGAITAHANGTATVTATVGSVSASVTVTVQQAVSSIDLAPETVTLAAIDQRAQFGASALDANGHPVDADIAYTSSEPMVAEIDETGVVIARRNGSSTITARSGAVSSTAAVTVMQVLDRVTVVPDDMMFSAIGESARVQVLALDANGYPMNLAVSLSSSEPAVASVDSTGLVTAQANGTATVTASIGMLSDSVAVTVEQQVAGVSVAPPDTPTLDALGATVQLQAIAQDANGHTVNVEFDWTSSDPAIAAVDATGLVTAQANGAVTVTATAGTLADSVAVTVEQQVAGVSIAPPDSDSLDAIGVTVQLQATAQDANGHTVDVEFDWSSSDPAIATVDATGLVTAQANGTATVTATAGTLADSVAVTVEQQVASVSLVPLDNHSLDAIGATVQLQAIARDANGHNAAVEFDWASSDPAIATVDATGLVTAQANGTVTVTATAGTFADSVAVTVEQQVAGVSLVPLDNHSLDAIGATVQLQAIAHDANGHNVNVEFDWTSADPAIATVDANGLVTAQANGTVTVTATAETLADSVAVTVNQQVASVSIDPPDSDSLNAIGATVQLRATARDANGHTVNVEFDWASSDPAIAAVDANGLVTAQANGTTTVTATATAGIISDSTTVTVDQLVASIRIDPPDSDSLNAIDATVQLQATARDVNGHTVSVEFDWASSDPATATVDATGLVTAQANGTTAVTAIVGMLSDSVAVTVKQQVARIDIDPPDSDSLDAIGATVQLYVSARDANGYTVNAELDWNSSDPSIAAVDAAGRVTAQANGTARIIVTVRNQRRNVSASFAIAVQVERPGEEPLTVSGDPNVSDSRTGRTPLHAAAMANAPRLIAALVAAGADVEARDRDDLTALHSAAVANAPAAIAALLEAGADIEARNRFGETPLIFAASRYAPTAIAALLEAGADPNAHTGSGNTALHRAAIKSGRARADYISAAIAMVAALLEAGADLNARNSAGQTPLRDAVLAENLASVRMLLDAGADPNARDARGWSPLWTWVGWADSPAILAALLENGADIDSRDDYGNPLIHLAAERDRPAVLRALLGAGADLNARNNAGRTPLHAAAGTMELGLSVSAAAALAVLLEAGADPNARDAAGVTALQLAPGGSRTMMSALLDAHAGRFAISPNARDEYGYTALHAAAQANSPRLIGALLAAGAAVDAVDNEGNTPLLLAAGSTWQFVRPPLRSSYSPAAIAALATAGADVEARDQAGFTAMHRASLAGATAAIAALLEAGADPRARDSGERTPLQVAFDESASEGSDTAAIVALAEAEKDLEGSDQNDFAAVLALAFGNPATLIEVRVDPNARDSRGRTALHWAARFDHSAALAALAEAGVDLNARDDFGRTALHWAVQERHTAMIEALVEAGADLDVRAYRGTPLHWAVIQGDTATVAFLAAAGADLEVRHSGRTPLQLAAYRGEPAVIAALAVAGANLEARDRLGRSALQLAANRDYPGQWNGGPSTPAAVAALLEAGANASAHDDDGSTALYAASVAGNQAATGILLALGANWTSDPDAGQADINARIVAMELFQGPMVWQWELAEPQADSAMAGIRAGTIADHAKTLLRRPTTVAVRIGSESPDPMPELSVSLSDGLGRAWAMQADLVRDPYVVSLPATSECRLWETEYVYELPADWVESGHRATFAIDPYNRLEETDENDNTATLTMDGHAMPVFDVTFVPVVFSGDPPAVDTGTLVAVIGDLLPIGDYRAQVGRVLDLSDRNLGLVDREFSRDTALHALLQRWNAEGGENEYYHGLLSTAEQSVVVGGIGVFGGIAYLAGNVAVSDAISEGCQLERVFCGEGVQAHELGHNFGLVHLPGRCTGPGPVDHAFPYAEAGIGPRRGWVATRNEFANPGTDNPYYDLMGACMPRFVSDYNYNKMVDFRLGNSQSPPSNTRRIGPSVEIGPAPAFATSATTLRTQTRLYAPPPGSATSTVGAGPGVVLMDAVEEIGPSLALAGAVDEYGLWSIGQLDASTQPPRSPDNGGEYFFTLWDAYQREIYREPMSLLTTVHGETRRAWAVRVPVPEQTPAWVAILDAQGTPLFIQPIDVPPIGGE